MPVKGIREVNRNFAKLTRDIAGKISQETLTKVMLEGLSKSAAITPNDTGNLILGQFKDVQPTSYGWRGVAGYIAGYSAYVHDAKGTLAGKPRQGKGKSGNYWDPDGEPEFLRKGFERDGIDQIRKIIINGYKLKG